MSGGMVITKRTKSSDRTFASESTVRVEESNAVLEAAESTSRHGGTMWNCGNPFFSTLTIDHHVETLTSDELFEQLLSGCELSRRRQTFAEFTSLLGEELQEAVHAGGDASSLGP